MYVCMYVCMYIYIYISISLSLSLSLSIYIYIYILYTAARGAADAHHGAAQTGVGGVGGLAAAFDVCDVEYVEVTVTRPISVLKILAFRGFDSSIILFLRGGIPMSMGTSWEC